MTAIVLLFAFFFTAPATLDTIPSRVDGQEISNLYGWWAAIYPNWPFVPEHSSVWPVPSLWTPSSWDATLPQTPAQIRRSAEQLTEYGSALDILEFNPNPEYPDFVLWKQGYLSQIDRLGRAHIERIDAPGHQALERHLVMDGPAAVILLAVDDEPRRRRASMLRHTSLQRPRRSGRPPPDALRARPAQGRSRAPARCHRPSPPLAHL